MKKISLRWVVMLVLAVALGNVQAAGIFVGLDIYHNNETPAHYTWDATDAGGFSEFKTVLESIGASTTTVGSEITSNALEDLDVLIIVDPDTAAETSSPNYISASEITAIKTWVDAGGVLMLMGNNAGNAEFTNFNLLAGEFGITFNEDTASGGPVYGPLPVSKYFLGAASLHIVGMSTLTVESPAQSIFTVGNETLIAVAQSGSGKVLAIGDPWIYNEYINHEDNKEALTALCGQLFAGHNGVPTLTITDYTQSPESWWGTHIFNSESVNYQPLINSPEPIVDVASVHAQNPGSTTAGIQEALDMLPPSGGTLWFPSSHGEYVITKEFQETKDIYPFGGSILILRRGNIHFVSDGATIKSDHTMFAIAGMEWADHPGNFNMDPSRASGFYFKGLTFDGNNQALFGAMAWRHADDMMVDDCVFQNFYQLPDPNNHYIEMGARTIISANTMCDNLWWRNCEFIGNMKRAVFIDGCHGGGVLNSTIHGNPNGGGITFPTNDDVTRDLNNDDIAQENEQRKSRYIVIAENLFTGTYPADSFAINLGASECLIYKNVVDTHITKFTGLGNRCHLTNEFGMEWYYELYNNIFIGNQIESCDIFYHMDIVGPLLDHPPARAGKYSIRCNRINNASAGFQWVAINKPEQLDGPNELEGNCLNDPSCMTSGCELRKRINVDYNLDKVVDMVDLSALAGHWLVSGGGTGFYGDFNVDDTVDYKDLSIFGDAWTGPDNEAPTVPQNFRAASVSRNSVNLQWDASVDNIYLAGYKLYKDGEYLANTTATSYIVDQLDPATTYCFDVSAYDSKNNESVSGSTCTLSVTTLDDGQNLIIDGGFEEGSTAWSGVISEGGETGYGELDQTVAYSGAYSYRVDGSTKYSYIRQMVENEYALVPETEYELTARIKTDNIVGGYVFVRIHEFDTTGGLIISRSSVQITGTNDWVQVSIPFTTDANHGKARVDLFWDHDSGSAWFDDVKLVSLIDDNLVDNPGFESGVASWSGVSGAGTGGLDTAIAHTGLASFSVTGGTAYIRQIFDGIDTPGLEPGSDYELSAWVKTDNVDGVLKVRYVEYAINPSNPDGSVVAVISSDSATGTQDWTKITATFTVIQDHLKGRVDLYWDNVTTGQGWYDDIELKKITTP